MSQSQRLAKGVLLSGAALLLLANCTRPIDFDLRNIADVGLDTSSASRGATANRPEPDGRGVVTYDTYSVAVARNGDTLAKLAERVGVSSAELARYNGMRPDTELRGGEIIGLPGGGRGAETSTSSASPETVTTSTLPSSNTNANGDQIVWQAGADPVRHKVGRGETAYTIARLYNVPVRTVAELNGLSADLSVREGQLLLVPQTNSTATTSTTAPGEGSPTPTPPSSTAPLPDESTVSAAATAVEKPPETVPALQQSASSSSGRFSRPVEGSIIRAYAPGRNEGIDIGAPAGSSVKAAANGTVAAVTKDTNGISIVVIRHDGGLLTVYTNIDNLTVQKGTSVSKGQTIGKVRADDPAFVHFEVRNGLESEDPNEYLR